MELLCDQIRSDLIESLSETGGHLASNLGAVELTTAIHRVFDLPEDKIVWDVGHQTYVHKMLTGRAGEFERLRQYGGLSGFPKRSESEYDCFDTGHSSNSISAALGMAAARDLRGESHAVAAVIGDGAMTGGMVYEALNNAGILKSGFIVILNDNGMSISRNRGSFSMHLSRLRTSRKYRDAKDGIKDRLDRMPILGDAFKNGLRAMRDVVKYIVIPGVMFEELGFTYLGPVDGHDLPSVIEALEEARAANRPVLVHCVTTKGRGYLPAERHPEQYHGTGPFDRETGASKKPKSGPTYSSVFGDKLMEIAAEDPNVTAITAAMPDGTGLKSFFSRYPHRSFDVGIAEEHAVSFAAGMAAEGLRPFVAIYSTFLQRAYDQILIDVCMQNLPVVFCLDRAGIAGEDGETHQGIFDLSYLSHMPGLQVLAPCDARQLRSMMQYAYALDAPCAIRYPKGSALDLSAEDGIYDPNEKEESSEGIRPQPRILRRGGDLTLAAEGPMTEICLRAADILAREGVDVTVIDAGIITPLAPEDIAVYRECAEETGVLITVEDNVIRGGYGSIVAELFDDDEGVTLHRIGWPDEFIPHGTRTELMHCYGLDGEGVAQKAGEIFERETGRSSRKKGLLSDEGTGKGRHHGRKGIFGRKTVR